MSEKFGFFRMETYGDKGHGQKKNRTCKSILQEAMRKNWYAHVAEPKPPIEIYGCADALLPKIKMSVNQAKKNGMTLRSDAQLMIGAVFSYPIPVIEMKEHVKEWRDSGVISPEAERYQIFRTLVKSFMKEEFGDRFKCALEHWDESYPHIHAYAVPKFHLGETMMDVHPGKRAFRESARRGEDRAKQHEEYKRAMAEMQDRFQTYVCNVLGWVKGPGNTKRTSRAIAIAKRSKALKHEIQKPTSL